MSHHEDEDLLNSDSDKDMQFRSFFDDNSVTAIISDGSDEEENVENENEENDKPSQKPKAFSDKDNKWLKLKKSDEDMEEEEDENEESEEEEEKVSKYPLRRVMEQNDFELEAEEEEKEKELVEKEARENLEEDLNKEARTTFNEQDEAVHDLSEMKDRIQDIVDVLSDFRRKRDPNTSREQYMNRLRMYCSKFYGYPRFFVFLTFQL